MPKAKLPQRSRAEMAKLRERAKELYFAYNTHQQICEVLKLDSRSLTDWRRAEGWDAEREGIERGIIEDAFSARKMSLARVTHLTTDQLERALKHLRDRPEPPTLNEAEKLSAIISALDKILRLDLGRSTENVVVQQTVHHTVESIRERLAADPVLGAAIEAAKAVPALPPPQQQSLLEIAEAELVDA